MTEAQQEPKKIESMYAFIAVDPEDGTEGIPAFMTPDGMAMPMVGADLERVESLRPIAEDLAARGDLTITLAHFSVREDQFVIDGSTAERLPEFEDEPEGEPDFQPLPTQPAGFHYGDGRTS